MLPENQEKFARPEVVATSKPADVLTPKAAPEVSNEVHPEPMSETPTEEVPTPKKTPVKKMTEKMEGEYSSIKNDPRFIAMTGDVPKEEAPGADQVVRIKELYEILGTDEVEAKELLEAVTNREQAKNRISMLTKMVQDQQGKGGKVNTAKEEYDENDDPVREPAEITPEEAAEAFADESPDYDSMSEEELRAALADAKVKFKSTLDEYKKNPTGETMKARSDASGLCAKINQALTSNGYGII